MQAVGLNATTESLALILFVLHAVKCARDFVATNCTARLMPASAGISLKLNLRTIREKSGATNQDAYAVCR
jgi:hypothetical protein